MILARRSWADARGLKQVAGCHPDEMGVGPILVIAHLYKYTRFEKQDVDIFELNEAFASQTVACINELGLDVDKVNPNGGAISIGHPTGATGARQVATILAELLRRDREIGITSMCARQVSARLKFIYT